MTLRKTAFKRPTILDVARHAGVSRSTVSRVLNEPDKVAADTVRRVTDAIQLLGFVASPTATALRRGRPQTLTLVTGTLALPFTGEFATMFTELAAERGHSVLLMAYQRSLAELPAQLQRLGRENTGGVLLALPLKLEEEILRDEITRLQVEGVRVVVSGSPLPGLSVPTFSIDFPAAARDATRRVVADGHTGVVLLEDPTIAQADDFRGAYTSVMREHGLGPITVEENVDATHDDGALVPLLREQRATAIIARSVRLAMAAATTASDLGMRDKVRIICCSRSALLDFVRPQMESYDVDVVQYSTQLLDAILHESTERPKHQTIPLTYRPIG